MRKLSRTAADSRFLPDRRGFPLGYTATLAVSNDPLIVAQRISRELNDNGLLVPLVDKVQRECGEQPGPVSADSGFFSLQNLEVMEERGIDAYVPDSNMACVLHHGGILKQPTRHAAPPWHAQQVSFDHRTGVISTAKSAGRAGHGNFARAARNAGDSGCVGSETYPQSLHWQPRR